MSYAQLQQEQPSNSTMYQPQQIVAQPQVLYVQQFPQQSNKRQDLEVACKDSEVKDKYKSDYCYSIVFLVLGIFTFIPLFFNMIYLRSPVQKARRVALASLIIATLLISIQALVSVYGPNSIYYTSSHDSNAIYQTSQPESYNYQ